jgi:hypothetical protein
MVSLAVSDFRDEHKSAGPKLSRDFQRGRVVYRFRLCPVAAGRIPATTLPTLNVFDHSRSWVD